MLSPIQSARVARPKDAFSTFDVEFNQFIAPLDGLAPAAPEGPSFSETLQGLIGNVEQSKAHAEKLTFDFATGKPVDVHTMMIAVAKADVLMQVTSAAVSKTAQGVSQLLQTQV